MLTGPKLKMLRSVNQITPEELSRLSEIEAATIEEFETGRRELDTATVRRLMSALDVKVRWSVDGVLFFGP